MKVILAAILALFVTSQFGVLCYFGQRLSSNSEGLINASYDCNWTKQSRKFRTDLLIFRRMCLKEVKIGVLTVDFSYKGFYDVSFVDGQSY